MIPHAATPRRPSAPIAASGDLPDAVEVDVDAPPVARAASAVRRASFAVENVIETAASHRSFSSDLRCRSCVIGVFATADRT
jgi:hypothetical protein